MRPPSATQGVAVSHFYLHGRASGDHGRNGKS